MRRVVDVECTSTANDRLNGEAYATLPEAPNTSPCRSAGGSIRSVIRPGRRSLGKAVFAKFLRVVGDLPSPAQCLALCAAKACRAQGNKGLRLLPRRAVA